MSYTEKDEEMARETIQTARDIRLTEEEYNDVSRLLQWPEDLERFDRIAKPTSLTEMSFMSCTNLKKYLG